MRELTLEIAIYVLFALISVEADVFTALHKPDLSDEVRLAYETTTTSRPNRKGILNGP